MKTNNPITKSLMAALLAALVLSGGCKNFMSNNDDFKKKIETEVAVANADKIPVRVLAKSGTGTPSPNGQVTEKVNVAFSLLMTPDSDYGFTRWAAYSTTDLAKELGAEVVSFADKTALETTATVHVARSDVQIIPLCEKRVKIATTSPGSGATGVFRNVPIRIYFSKPVASSSFIFDGGTMRSGGLFKNLTITGFIGTADPVSYVSYFKDPVLNSTGKILTLYPDTTNLVPAGTTLTIEYAKDITDTSGLSMPDSGSFSFRYGSGNDNKNPLIDIVKVGLSSTIYLGDEPRRVSCVTGRNFYIYVAATDKIGSGGLADPNATGSGLMLATVSERRITDAMGTSISESFGATDFGLTYDDDYVANLGDPYPLRSTGDGLIELSVQVQDSTANVSTPYTYNIIRDTTPPQPASNSIAVSGQTAGGYFNGAANATATFTPGTLQDYGSATGNLRSADVWYSAGFNADGSTGWTGWQECVSGSPVAANITVPSGVADSDSVPVYWKLKDDLDNESAVTQCSTVKKDATKPSATVTVKDTVSFGTTKTVTTYSPGITVSGSDNLSGNDKYYYSMTATAPTTASASHASGPDGWIAAASTSGTADNGAQSITLGASDGSYTVNAWMMDKAGNISVAGTDTVFVDTQAPTISSFYVSTSTITTSGTTTTLTDPAAQYAKSPTVNFAFNASDAGTGVGSFQYSDDGGATWSSWFELGETDAANWTILSQQSSLPYNTSLAVSNVFKTPAVGHEVTVYGKMAISATNDTRTIQIKVRDRAHKETTARSSGNSLVYDDLIPNTATVTFVPSGTSFVNGDITYVKSATGHKMKISASDQKPAGDISGIKSAHVQRVAATDMTDTDGFDVALSGTGGTQTVTDVVSEAFDFAVGDGLKSINVTTYDYAGNTNSDVYSMVYLDTTPPAFSLIIKQNSAAGSGGTNSTAGSVLLYGPTLSSALWPSFYTYMTSHVETGSGIPTGATQEMTLYRATSYNEPRKQDIKDGLNKV